MLADAVCYCQAGRDSDSYQLGSTNADVTEEADHSSDPAAAVEWSEAFPDSVQDQHSDESAGKISVHTESPHKTLVGVCSL